jgi:molybdate transport system regulatory protein
MVEVQSHIIIKREGKLFLGPMQIALLREIMKQGSLRSAAQSLDISYQNAWSNICRINEMSPCPVVMMQRGGVNGGGAGISEYGLKIIEEYEMIVTAVQKTINQINVEINL